MDIAKNGDVSRTKNRRGSDSDNDDDDEEEMLTGKIAWD